MRRSSPCSLVGVFVLPICLLAAVPSVAGDWPHHLHDSRRSGASAERLELPLNRLWRHTAPHPPRPSWPPPAEGSHWQRLTHLEPRVTFDRAFHVVVASGRVFYGSSSDDHLRCLDAASGHELWSFVADGPIRFAPAVAGDRVFFGSDDGSVRCLRATDGRLEWRHSAAPSDRRIAGNGRLISCWPVRTSVLVDGGAVYACCGLFPTQGVFAFAIDAASGEELWRRRLSSVSPQGYLLASENLLFVPMGRASPVAIKRADGAVARSLPGVGGAFAVVAGEALVTGPGDRGELALADATGSSGDRLAVVKGRHLAASPTHSFVFATDDGDDARGEIRALDRRRFLALSRERRAVDIERRRRSRAAKTLRGEERNEADERIATLASKRAKLDAARRGCVRWRVPSELGDALIVAGEHVVAGGNGTVAIYSAVDGGELWRASVEGRAYGLAVSDGRLFVSTDRGAIVGFGAAREESVSTVDGAARRSGGELASKRLTRAAIDAVALAGGPDARGFCLVLDCGTGRLALEIARRSNLRVVGVDSESDRVRRARELLVREGFYGERVTVHHVAGETLPFASSIANLVVSERLVTQGETSVSESEARRVVRPYGGVALLDGKPYRRPAPPGAGEWTHQYADPGNTASSGDRLVSSELELQWFGGPGPRRMIDRHLRTVPPLVSHGRLIIPGDDLVIAVDAYNGTELWEARFPGSRRFGAPFDTSYLASGAERVFVATGSRCHVLDAASGGAVSVLDAPIGDWGYVAVVGDTLFGSAQKPTASRKTPSRADVVEQYREDRPLATSDALFAFDWRKRERLWTYAAGRVLNTSLTVGRGRLYFLQSPTTKSAGKGADDDGRASLRELLADGAARLVALDAGSGKVVWTRSFPAGTARHALYGAFSDGVFLVVGSTTRSRQTWYFVRAFDAATGAPLWQRDHPNNRRAAGGNHGEQVHHPVIADGRVVAEPLVYDLHSGDPVDPSAKGAWSIPARGGCGTLSASASCLFFRDSNPILVDLGKDGARKRLTKVNRPGCWISVIPAGGLVVMPEASSGCVCGYPLQTSMAFSAFR